MAKSLLKLKAIQARRTGKSIKEIAKDLSVSVGSVSSWCRDIVLTEHQISLLKKRVTDPYYGKKLAYIQKIKEATNKKTQILKHEGIKEVGELSTRDLFIAGIALYWGEGFKKDHQVGFATSDIRMAKFFITWLQRCFTITKEDLVLRVTLNQAYRTQSTAIENYWSRELNIPLENFRRVTFQQTVWKKSFELEEKYKGVIRIRIKRSMDFLRKIQGYIEGLAIQVNF